MTTIKYYTSFATPMGTIVLTSRNEILTGCYFENQKNFPSMQGMTLEPNLPIFIHIKTQLEEYIAKNRKTFSFTYELAKGTEFQQKVWRALLNIEHGKTMSYKELACMINAPKSIRAVANAVGRNPISIMIPCHRIIGSDGSLTGYAGGIDKKKALLSLEEL